jgi:hypothetical protein
MLDFVKGIMRSSAGRIDEMQIPWLLTDPSEQFWFADALNLEIHDPFKKGSAKNGGAERQLYFVTDHAICLYDKLRTPLESCLPSGTCFWRRPRISPLGLTSGISPKNSQIVCQAVCYSCNLLVFKKLP